MVIYRFNQDNQLLETYDNVINWGNKFIEYKVNDKRTKLYAFGGEYFSDKETGNLTNTLQEQINNLKSEQTDIEEAIVELSSNMEDYQTANELALAELADLLTEVK